MPELSSYPASPFPCLLLLFPSLSPSRTLIDNGNPSAGSFQQRFYYDTTFCGDACGTSSNVVLFLGGEWTVQSVEGGAVADLASQLNALQLSLEHRAYGASLFAPYNSPLMQQYLTVEQAIQDIGSFIPYALQLTANLYGNGQLQPRKLVIVGGSYSGALSIWSTVRLRDSGLITATWASSGVANAIFNYTAFDEAVSTAVGPTCKAALQAVTAAAEQAWDTNASTQAQLLQLFGVPAGYLTRADFMWMLADSGAMGPQYGFKDLMCSYLLTPNSAPGYLTGWPALTAFQNWTVTHYGAEYPTSCYYSTQCLSNPQTYQANYSDSTTWVWQCCSQVAYWQASYIGSIRSSALTTDYFVQQCQAAFGPSVFANTTTFNARYGGANPIVNSNNLIVAYQGSDDPWLPAGVDQTLSSNVIEFTAQCDGCSHCRDLHGDAPTDPPALQQTRHAIQAQLVSWITDGVAPAKGSSLSAGAAAGITAGVFSAAFLLGWVISRNKKAQPGAAASTYSAI